MKSHRIHRIRQKFDLSILRSFRQNLKEPNEFDEKIIYFVDPVRTSLKILLQ